MNAKFRGHRIGIIGLGGTGGYILDQVSKTWVDAIELFDGVYSHMHTGITANPVFITADNLELLGNCTFVFMAAADADDKPAILAWLRERGIPTIEVGMGIRDEGGYLSGLVAVVNHFPGMPELGLTAGNTAPDEYDRNIQTADLSERDARSHQLEEVPHLLRRVRPVDETVYRIFTGIIRNGEQHATENAENDAA